MRPKAVRSIAFAAAVGIGVVAFGVVELSRHQTREQSYYVSAEGDDSADGHSPSSAWKTIDRVNAAQLTAGDRVYFQGGSEFRGLLRITSRTRTNPLDPIVIGSYGSGRATLANSAEAAVYLKDTNGITLQDLDVVGPGAESAAFDGISLFNDLPGGTPHAGMLIQRVSVTGFKHGIAIGAAAWAPGFGGLSVLDSVVSHNRLSGLITYGPTFDAEHPSYAHRDIHISGVEAADNIGDPTIPKNSGSGIVVGSVTGARVDHSTAHHNGERCDAIEGPAGIWSYDSTKVVIEHNLAYANKTGRSDGHGFDLDQNVSDSVLQYNLAYDNAGAGYMLFSNADNQAHDNNRVRFNISVNDATFNGFYGAITLFGGLKGPDSSTGIFHADIYHNTVVVEPSKTGKPPAIMVLGTMRDVRVLNNIFVANAGAQLIRAKAFTNNGISFLGNAYYAESTRNPFEWNGGFFPTLPAWREASDQEILDGEPVGTGGDPKLRAGIAPTTITTVAQLHNADGLRLDEGSPVTGRGVDLARLHIDRGRQDYYADPLPAATYDAGAAVHATSG